MLIQAHARLNKVQLLAGTIRHARFPGFHVLFITYLPTSLHSFAAHSAMIWVKRRETKVPSNGGDNLEDLTILQEPNCGAGLPLGGMNFARSRKSQLSVRGCPKWHRVWHYAAHRSSHPEHRRFVSIGLTCSKSPVRSRNVMGEGSIPYFDRASEERRMKLLVPLNLHMTPVMWASSRWRGRACVALACIVARTCGPPPSPQEGPFMAGLPGTKWLPTENSARYISPASMVPTLSSSSCVRAPLPTSVVGSWRSRGRRR